MKRILNIKITTGITGRGTQVHSSTVLISDAGYFTVL
jgi:hypothetical protein